MNPRSTCLALALLGAAPAAQTLVPGGGALGGALTYDLGGPSGQVYALLLSQSEGPTPLALIDPGDLRVLDVGLDLLPYVQSGVLLGGAAQVSLPLPSNPALSGTPLFAQFVTLPGTTTVVDVVSERADVVLCSPAASHFALGPLASSRQAVTVTSLDDGRLLVAGGDLVDGDGAAVQSLDTWELFDPATLTFTGSANTLTTPRAAHSATKLLDGRVLLVGGYADPSNPVAMASAEIYDPVTDTSTPAASMSTARAQNTATLLPDGRVFVAGGTGLFDLTQAFATLGATRKSTEVYDPVTDSWSPGPDLPERLMGHAASPLTSGRVVITAGVEVADVFGIDIPSFTTRCHRYNPANNTLTEIASIPGGGFAYHAQITLDGGKPLVAGGADGNLLTLDFTPRPTVYRYETGSDSWTTVAPLTYGRAYLELVQVGSQVLAIGGLKEADLVTHYGTPEDRIEATTTAFTLWSHVASMKTLLPRELLRAAPFDGGQRILIVGAGDDGTPAVDATAEVYLP